MKIFAQSQIRCGWLTLLMAATAAVATSAQTPTPSPNGKIAFVSDRDGNTEIYVMDANGSNPTRLTNNTAEEFGPAWSPDGTKIAFQSRRDGNYEIYVMDANGSNPVNLTNHPSSDFVPAWSPDGNKIVFVSLRDSFFHIWVMNADGSNQTRLTSDPKAGDRDPAWSSTDLNKIAYHSLSVFTNDNDVWVMDANGSNKINLTNNPTSFDGLPAWSPDGAKIAFTTSRAGNDEIYVMDADGSNPINLTNHLSSDGSGVWSPDGAKIVFSTGRDGNSEIYVMDANGSNPVRLTNNPAFDLVPDWQRLSGFVTPTPAPTPTPSPTASPTPAADVSGNMTDSPDPVQVGQNLTYTILVSNGGPSGPAFVTVADVVPANTTFVSVTPTQGSCTGTGFINCDLGAIAAFGSATVTLVVTPTQAGTVSNSAQVTSSTFPDPNTGNNFPSQSTTVLPAGSPTATPTSPTPTPSSTPIPTTPTPTPTPTPTSPTPTPTSTPTPSPTPAAQAINLSTRMRVLTGDSVGIGGFIITGTAPKHVLIRAIGPSLIDFGIPDALPDTVLELHGPSGFATVINNNWRDDPIQEALIKATGIPPSSDLESAIDANLTPGAYTAVVRGNNNSTGVALIEVYDLGHAASSKLANISTRAFVSTGNDIVIAGFILGSGSGNDRIVVRGLGPSLADFGVPDVLANPTLELRDNNGTLLIANNDWQDDPIQASEITAAGLALANDLESGIAATLAPGPYTALLAGLNNGTGNGVVEVYDRGGP